MPIKDNKDAHLKRFAAFRSSRDLRTAAFDMVGGGDYEMIGFAESLILNKYAPVPPGGKLIDIGCGPGRLARYLKNRPDLRYLGTDVVPELLVVAAQECNRDDWEFLEVDEIQIPAADKSADVVTSFSIFTNVYPEESFALIREASRVLKPGGKLLVSYFDIELPNHRKIFIELVAHYKDRIDPLVFLSRQFIEFFAAENGFYDLLFVRPDEFSILPEPGSQLLDGRIISTGVGFSQMICVMTRQ